MRTIIVGASSVGVQIARHLIAEGRDLVLVDKDEESLREAANTLDCLIIQGEANRRETLSRAGAQDAELFISVTESDELNIIACSLAASEFQIKTTVARVRNEEYSQAIESGTSFMGLTHAINPDVESARAVLRTIEHGVISEIMKFQDSNLEMRTLTVSDSFSYAGRPLAEIKRDSGKQFLVAVVVRNGETIVPSGTTVVLPQDQLYLIGVEGQLEEVFVWFGRTREVAKNILLIGGSRVGRYLIAGLLGQAPPEDYSLREDHKDHRVGKTDKDQEGHKNHKNRKDPDRRPNLFERLLGYFEPKSGNGGRSLTVIESDYEICRQLAQDYPNILVKQGDVSEDPVLEEEDLSSYDLLIAATDNPELNLIAAVYGKSIGVKRVVTLLRKTSYLSMANRLGVDAAVSFNATIVNSILRLVRKGNIKSLHSFAEGRLEFVELTCQPKDSFDGKRVQDIRLPKDTLILFLTRENATHLPYGALQVQAGDRLVLVTTSESVRKLEDLTGGAR